MSAPILANDVIKPIADPLYLVGYTSGVYTNTAWNTPVANPRAPNRNNPRYTLTSEKELIKERPDVSEMNTSNATKYWHVQYYSLKETASYIMCVGVV